MITKRRWTIKGEKGWFVPKCVINKDSNGNLSGELIDWLAELENKFFSRENVDCCKGCKKRWFDSNTGKTCHSSCEKYIEYKSKREIELQQRKLNNARLVTKAREQRHEEYKKRGRRK